MGPKSSTRKITRKAIQDVNIPKACLTIIDPGAPIALRLQSNLLYGVSRVYSQQYAYMLGDTEKVQAHIQTFYRVWGNSTIDLQADKTTARQVKPYKEGTMSAFTDQEQVLAVHYSGRPCL